MSTPATIEHILRVAGLDPRREKCQNRCVLCTQRRPCDCFPGINAEQAIRLYRAFEADRDNKDNTPQNS